MRPIAVVVIGEFGEHAPKVGLFVHDHMVKTLSPNASHHSLGDRVRLGLLRLGSHPGNAQSGQPLVKVPTVIRVPIVNEKCRLPTQGRRLHHLAPDPGGRRAGRHVEVNPFAPVVSNQEEDIEDAVAYGLHDEELGGPDATQLIGQEGTPVLGSAGLDPTPTVGPDRAVADDNTQLQQPDALAAPKGILLGNSGDKRTNLRTQAGPPESGARLPGPIQAPTLPMPTQHCLRSDEAQMLSPASRPDTPEPHPDDSISRPQPRMRVGTQRDLKLMAKRRVLQHQITTRPHAGEETTNDEEQQNEHGRSRYQAALNAHRTGSTFAALPGARPVPALAKIDRWLAGRCRLRFAEGAVGTNRSAPSAPARIRTPAKARPARVQRRPGGHEILAGIFSILFIAFTIIGSRAIRPPASATLQLNGISSLRLTAADRADFSAYAQR